MKEAARIHNNFQFAMQSKTAEPKKLDEEDPFIETEGQVICSQGYFYKIYNLGKDFKICIRSSVHAYIE